MKKFGILVFIAAILVGVVFANLFSFGRASGKVFSFSFGESLKGSGVIKSETRQTAEFKGVDAGGIFNVEVTLGKGFGVEVEADDNLLEHIRTEVRGGVLKIETAKRLKSDSPIRVRVSAPDLETVEVSGASKMSVTGVNNAALKIDTSGASQLKVDGFTSNLTVDISGASKIEASNLKAENASVDASGASSVNLFVTGRLVSEASGASKIAYEGTPSSVDKNASGAGRIYQK